MLGIFVAVGFMGMVLSPSAVALYSRLGTQPEGKETMAPSEKPADPVAPPARVVDVTINDRYTRRPVPLSTSALSTSPRSSLPLSASPLPPVALQPVPSLREIAEQAVRQATQARAEAAQAHLQALQEVSRAASRRAEAASKLADAAERELVLAAQASLQAEQAKQRAKATQTSKADQDYLPHDHPSLDFPRSRVPSRRVA